MFSAFDVICFLYSEHCECVAMRDVFSTLPNIYDGTFFDFFQLFKAKLSLVFFVLSFFLTILLCYMMLNFVSYIYSTKNLLLQGLHLNFILNIGSFMSLLFCMYLFYFVSILLCSLPINKPIMKFLQK